MLVHESVDQKTYHYITTKEEFNEVVVYLNEYVENADNPKLALDVETYLLDALDEDSVPRPIKFNNWYQGMIKTIQIGLPPEIADIQFVIDVEALGNPRYIGEQLKNCLENSVIIGQNLKYEYQFMSVHMGIFLNRMRDCMLLSQVLMAGDKIRHGLAYLYARYMDPGTFITATGMNFTEYESFKERSQKSKWRGELTEDQIRYAADDVKLVFPLYDGICEAVDVFIARWEGKNDYYQTLVNTVKLECSLIPVYAMMELRGIEFDREHHRTVISFLTEQKKVAEQRVYDLGSPFVKKVQKSNGKRGKARETWFEDEVINLASPKQIKDTLAAIGIQLPEKNATSAETLRKFEKEHPFVQYILDFKLASSLLSKFGEKLITMCASCGRLYPNWFQIGSDEGSIDTGRSCCQGPNIQQIPNKAENIFGMSAAELFRKSFIAKSGYILVDADFSQIEPRVTAQLCQEVDQIKAFQSEREVDTHALTAKAAFGLNFLPSNAAITKLKESGQDALASEYKTYRNVGKVLNLGIGYGMGAAKLARRMSEATGKNYTVVDAKKIIEVYYANLPGIKAMKAYFERLVKKRPEAFGSLAPFKGREPICVAFTAGCIDPITGEQGGGRPRRFCLKMAEPHHQERLAREDPEQLSKYYEDGHGQNEYNMRISECAREAYNFLVQGTSADIMKKALRLIFDEMNAAGVFDIWTEGVVAVVHDEVLVEVKNENKALALEIVERCMVKAAETILTDVPAYVNMGSGSNWADAADSH